MVYGNNFSSLIASKVEKFSRQKGQAKKDDIIRLTRDDLTKTHNNDNEPVTHLENDTGIP